MHANDEGATQKVTMATRLTKEVSKQFYIITSELKYTNKKSYLVYYHYISPNYIYIYN